VTFYPWYRYAHQKTCSAQRTLVFSDDPLRKRLENAYTYWLAVIKPDEFPPELRGQFVAIRAALTWAPGIAATCAAISDAECWRVAGLILDLHNAVSQEDGVHLERTRATPLPRPPVETLPEADPAEMPAREIADLLRSEVPAGKLAEVVELLLAERKHTTRLLQRVRRKRGQVLSFRRRVLGVGSNDDEKENS
jgi:hypothetical protein